MDEFDMFDEVVESFRVFLAFVICSSFCGVAFCVGLIPIVLLLRLLVWLWVF